MSKNILQVYTDNPIFTNQGTDLMYFGRAPYDVGDDTAMLFSSFAAQFGAPYTPSALTKVDDTNVTLTLGGTPATALLHAVSLTLGWTGQLSGSRGGTNFDNGIYTARFANGDLSFANSFTTMGNFSVIQRYTGATDVTFPTSGTLATTTSASGHVSPGLVNQMAWYAASGDTVSGLATVANSVLSTDGSGVPSLSTTLPQSLLIPNPNIGGSGLFDSNGNAILALGATASAVNYYQLVNAAAGGSPYFLASGASTDIAIQLFAKGNAGIIAAAGVGGSVPLSLIINSTASRADFNIAGLSTTRTFTLPDASGTIALTSTASGIVNSGTANQIAWYATTGTAVSGLSTANNAVLGTNGSGVPSFSTTLPSGLSATNMNLTTPTLGVATATSISFGGSALSNYAQSSSYTPTITFDTPGDLSVSYSLQIGTYTRIGNIVSAHFVLSCTPTFTTASGLLRIALPVTPSANGVGSVQYQASTWPVGTTSIMLQVVNGNSGAVVGVNGSAIATYYISTTQATSGQALNITCSVTYLV